MQQSIECKYCGAPIDISLAVGGVAECAYCHRKHILAKSSDKNAVQFLAIAEHDLDTCKFDDAFAAFQKAAEYDNGEPEAYFGMALAEFRVQYIKDVVNERLQAVCHDISERAFSQNKNYKKALELATYEQREEYTNRANEIDYIRNEFYKLKDSGLDYDCFICVKVTDEHGGKTKDYKTADDLYFHLRGKGYNPFFSEREMAGRTGVDYEALILYALHTSECMLVVCSDESYLNTPWVKNEYTRFIELIADKQKEDDSITIVFGGAPIERLPGRSGRIQGVDIGRADAYGKIEQYVESHTPAARARRESAATEEEKLKAQLREQAELQARQLEEFKAQQERARLELESKLAAVKNSSAPQAGNNAGNSAALLVRVKQFMSAGDFNKAKEYCERVLDMEPNNAEAWWLLLLVDLKVTNAENWQDAVKNTVTSSTQITELKNRTAFINAKRYASSYERFVQLEKLLVVLYNELLEFERLRSSFKINGSTIVKYIGYDSKVVIPNGVMRIGNDAFKNRSDVTHIAISNSVISIGDSAFCGCIRLTNIEIPDSVMRIGDRAFSGCSSLMNIKIPNSVTSIEDCAFLGCCRLKSIEIPNSVTSIEEGLFNGCGKLTSIKIQNSVTSIGNGAFDGCCSLTSIEIPNSVTSIGNSAFNGCSSLTSIEIPNSVTSIGQYAFVGCEMLKSIKIPNSVTSIGQYAFEGCERLKSIEIPNKVTSIGNGIFSGCSSLTSIKIPNSVTSIGDNAFEGCERLKSIDIPNSVTSIGDEAFSDCSGLTSIEIPNSVVYIGHNAFSSCDNLQEVTIPEKFKSRIKDIFEGVKAITGLFKKAKITYI